MPRLKLALPVLLLAWLGAAASATALSQSSGTYACRYKHFKTCSEGNAQVTLQDGKLQSVSFANQFCPVKKKPPATCALQATRSGQQAWADDGRTTSITFADPKHPHLEDVFAVMVEDERIVLDFSDAQPITRCTDGGDLPDRIVIDPRSETCRVES